MLTTILLELGDYGTHIINGVLTNLPRSRSAGSIDPLDMPQVPEYIIAVDLFGIGSLPYRVRAIIMRLRNSSSPQSR